MKRLQFILMLCILFVGGLVMCKPINAFAATEPEAYIDKNGNMYGEGVAKPSILPKGYTTRKYDKYVYYADETNPSGSTGVRWYPVEYAISGSKGAYNLKLYVDFDDSLDSNLSKSLINGLMKFIKPTTWGTASNEVFKNLYVEGFEYISSIYYETDKLHITVEDKCTMRETGSEIRPLNEVYVDGHGNTDVMTFNSNAFKYKGSSCKLYIDLGTVKARFKSCWAMNADRTANNCDYTYVKCGSSYLYEEGYEVYLQDEDDAYLNILLNYNEYVSIQSLINGYIGKDPNNIKTTTIAADKHPVLCPIYLDANGGTVSQSVFYEHYKWTINSFTGLPEATLPGYNFKGWYTAPVGGVGVYEEDVYVPLNGITLYAQYELAFYTLYVHSGGEYTACVEKPQLYYGQSVTLSVPSEKIGYTFIGYNTNADGTGTWLQNNVYTHNVYEDNQVYAQYTPKQYTFQYKCNGGTCTETSKTVTYNTTVGTLPTPTRVGHEFTGWFFDKALTDRVRDYYTFVDYNMKNVDFSNTIVPIYAGWKALDYRYLFVLHGGTLPSGVDDEMYITCGAPCKNLPIPTKAGYTFSHWEMENGTIIRENSVIPVTADMDRFSRNYLYARYTPNTYKVTMNPCGGVVGVKEMKVTYAGTYGTLPIPTRKGYTFKGWFTEEQGGSQIIGDDFVTILQDINLYAHWEKNPDDSREPNEENGNQEDPNEENKDENPSVEHDKGAEDGKQEDEEENHTTDETAAITDETILTLPDDGDIKGSSFVSLQARAVKTTKNSIRLKWKSVKNADGYIIYGNQCGKKNRYKKIKTITGAGKTQFTHKKLKKGKYYKYIIRAYKLIDEKPVTMAASKTIHASTTGGKYGNAKAVKIKTGKKLKKKSGNYVLSLKKNKTFILKASEVKQSKKIRRHRKIAFESTDSGIAFVNKKGVVRGKRKGSCYVYAYAQNGVFTKIKVNVK